MSHAIDNLKRFYTDVEMPGGWLWSHPKTLRMIDHYYYGKFMGSKTDAKGFEKFFDNVGKPSCDIATKFVDLSTRDIQTLPQKSGDERIVFLMQRRLRQWLDEGDFGLLLNDIAQDYPKYGSVVLKKARKKWSVVPLSNLRMDPTARSLRDSGFIYELHVMYRDELSRKTDWDQTAIARFATSQSEPYLIYECYEKSAQGWTRSFKACLCSGSGTLKSETAMINQGQSENVPEVVLKTDELDARNFPYRELHWERVPGRWLGYGFMEYLEDNQVALNETEYLERKSLMFTSLKLYQTADPSVGGQNVLDADFGNIFTVDGDGISPIPVEERNLPAFANARGKWMESTTRKTFTTDITRGANLPSRTPLGVANLQAQLATSYFEIKRENFGLFVKKLLLEDIIPDFKNDTRAEHVMTFLGSDDELDKLDQMIAETKVRQEAKRYAFRTGFAPSKPQMEDMALRVKRSLGRTKNRYLDIPKGFFDDAKFYLKVTVTGESVDVGRQSQIIMLALQILGTNPNATHDPITRTAIFKLLELGGINPIELNLPMGESSQAGMMPVAGSLAMPNAAMGMAPSPQAL